MQKKNDIYDAKFKEMVEVFWRLRNRQSSLLQRIEKMERQARCFEVMPPSIAKQLVDLWREYGELEIGLSEVTPQVNRFVALKFTQGLPEVRLH